MTVGYARVSTPEQNISDQVEVLKENGCEKVFTDIASDFLEDRVGLNDMLSYLPIMVYKTDRIFRSLKNMIDLIERLMKKEFYN
jgi:DNA invertase Pin-like site-specific DNA recombinase